MSDFLVWQGHISVSCAKCIPLSIDLFFLLDQSQRGSLFTLFLNNPLMAFLFVSGLSSMRRGLWEKCQDYLRKINRDIAQLLTHSRSIGTAWPAPAQPARGGLSLSKPSFLCLLHRSVLSSVFRGWISSLASHKIYLLFGYYEDAQNLPGMQGCLCLCGSSRAVLAQVGGSKGWAGAQEGDCCSHSVPAAHWGCALCLSKGTKPQSCT